MEALGRALFRGRTGTASQALLRAAPSPKLPTPRAGSGRACGRGRADPSRHVSAVGQEADCAQEGVGLQGWLWWPLKEGGHAMASFEGARQGQAGVPHYRFCSSCPLSSLSPQRASPERQPASRKCLPPTMEGEGPRKLRTWGARGPQ